MCRRLISSLISINIRFELVRDGGKRQADRAEWTPRLEFQWAAHRPVNDVMVEEHASCNNEIFPALRIISNTTYIDSICVPGIRWNARYFGVEFINTKIELYIITCK